MNFSDYAALRRVNSTALKEMRKSPLHFAYREQNPLEDTARLALGRAAHCAVFEPDRFLLDYVAWDGDRRGKAYAEFAERNSMRTILKTPEWDATTGMALAVRAHPVAGPMLAPPGEAEKVILWEDEATGLPCKARLDWWRVGMWCDLKTTTTLDVRLFSSTAWRLGYHTQMAFYRNGLIANGLDAPPPRIVAVEITPPHDCAVFVLDDDALYAGEKEVAELMAKVAAGRFSGKWPGRYQDEVALSLPHWALAQSDDEAFGITIEGETA